MCIGKDPKDGYGYDPDTGFWVHRVYKSKYGDKEGCNKPSVLACVLECDECGIDFVPAKKKTVDLSFLGVMCPKCESEL